MFRRCLTLLLTKTKSAELYSSRERLLYSYWNGRKRVSIDPIEQYKKLMEVWPSIDSDMLAAFSPLGSKMSIRCHESMVQTMRKAFDGLEPHEKGGLTESYVIRLVSHFFDYCHKIEAEFKDVCDITDGNLAIYTSTYFPIWRRLFFPRPTYREYMGFCFNRKRIFYRRSSVIAFGAGIALGVIDPGMGYYRAITDGEGEAMLLKAKTDSLRKATSDGE